MSKKAVILTIGLLIICSGFLLLYNGIIWFVYPDYNEYPVFGLDVSHHQGEIDWDKLSEQNIDFIFIKATEGDDWVDNRFHVNWNRAIERNIAVGAYHFFSLSIPGDLQADNFINTVQGDSGKLPPVIDLEFGGNSRYRPTKEEFNTEFQKYYKKVAEYYGKEPILYITYEFYDFYLGEEYNNGSLWIRDIFSYPKSHIKNWLFWQYKNRGRIEGIDSFVDFNIYNGSNEDFLEFMDN